VAISRQAAQGSTPRWSDYLALTKPGITLFVTLTALVGFVLASPGSLEAGRLAGVLAGTALVASGAAALNMVLERGIDARMQRTRGRPLPAGRISTGAALVFGAGLSLLGWAVLVVAGGLTPAGVSFLTWALYLFFYTPLKPRTSLATLFGAVPGALPPLIGWLSARPDLGPGAFALFAIQFLWQIPHFLAIAWMYRDDYAAGGLPMLPVLDGSITARQAVATSAALLFTSLTPVAARLAGALYAACAVAAGAAVLSTAIALLVTRSRPAARRLFFASLAYLPLVCVALLLDRRTP
jgi:protoheme IX farnesyltransferase